ncbi:MAG TPA: hypothetical protein VHL08_06135 [Dongiaceae bacterium]|nr:hypothetical protein [Dongiaceae bacterium]
MTYNPGQRYAHGSYPRYDGAPSRDKNPLFNALKGKIQQLKAAPVEALRLIVACDGDSALLRQSSLMYSPGTYSARGVAEDFLRQNSSIDAILLVTIDEQKQVFDIKTSYQLKCDLIVAPLRARSSRMTSDNISMLDSLLRNVVAQMPLPIQSAYNAAQQCRESGRGPDVIGGYKVNNHQVSLSSRALQRLLAGEMTVDEFIAAHGWNKESGAWNPFARMKNQGRMINEIKIESDDGEDDDWLVFCFGLPDPATAAFCLPP